MVLFEDWSAVQSVFSKEVRNMALFSFAQAARKQGGQLALAYDPWFKMVEHVALPAEESDLAWNIPQKFWEVETATGPVSYTHLTLPTKA